MPVEPEGVWGFIPPGGGQIPTPPDAQVSRLAADQHGRVSAQQLLACGLTTKAIEVRVRRGQLHHEHHGVYAVGHRAWTLHGCFMAAVLAGGEGAVLSHASAAALWGFLPRRRCDIDVIVPGDRGRTQRGLRVHRARSLDPRDVTRHYGIRVTTAARTCSTSPPCCRQGRSGDGLPHPEVNKPLERLGRRIVPDFRWPAQRLVVEADGAAWHDGMLAREDDAERQAILEAAGERVIRITWDQALRRSEQSLQRVWAGWRR